MSTRRIMLPMLVALVGMGLGMWAMATPAHGTAIVLDPLTITKTASDGNHFWPGDNAYYDIAIFNPNDVTVDLNHVVDTLPSGFSYAADSTTNFVSFNPSIAGQTLTWSFEGDHVGAGLTVHLDFTAVVSQDEPVGMYCNEASVDWGSGTASTGLTAPIQVLNEGDTEVTPTCGQPGLVRSATATVTATVPATVTPVPSTATPMPPTATATATQPSGGSAGAISAPNTGTGASAAGGGPSAMLLAVAALMVVGGFGAAAAGAIRR